jgi:pimeloyl-ACP methyl ester carboxylesterase
LIGAVAMTAAGLIVAAAGAPSVGAAQEAGAFAQLSGVTLWFTDTGGNGVPLVLLHANTGTSAAWEPQVDAFARAGYRVIAFDRRGWGRSIAVADTGPQPGSIAGDLDALASHLKLDKFHLLGVAGGGFASLDYAAWHPESLRSLIVAASTGQISDWLPLVPTFGSMVGLANTGFFAAGGGVFRMGDEPRAGRQLDHLTHHGPLVGLAAGEPLREIALTARRRGLADRGGARLFFRA